MDATYWPHPVPIPSPGLPTYQTAHLLPSSHPLPVQLVQGWLCAAVHQCFWADPTDSICPRDVALMMLGQHKHVGHWIAPPVWNELGINEKVAFQCWYILILLVKHVNWMLFKNDIFFCLLSNKMIHITICSSVSINMAEAFCQPHNLQTFAPASVHSVIDLVLSLLHPPPQPSFVDCITIWRGKDSAT